MRKQKPSARLENWAVVPSGNIATYKELKAGNLLVGRVFGHPTFAEGAFIFSSPILSLDTGANIAETRNTAYLLGEASREYKVWSEQAGAAA
jgi:hypothetical protein